MPREVIPIVGQVVQGVSLKNRGGWQEVEHGVVQMVRLVLAVRGGWKIALLEFAGSKTIWERGWGVVRTISF